MSKASATMSKAKAALILEQAFFASILCRMPLVEDESVPTLATNGQWVRYNPAFVDSLTFDEIKFVCCHEVLHAALDHPFRCGERDHKRWNQACDYVINGTILTAGKGGTAIGSMPKGGLHNPQLVSAAGGTEDGVYNLLPPATDDGSGGQGNGHGDPLDDCVAAEGTEAERNEARAEMKVKVAQALAAAKMCGQAEGSLERLVEGALKPRVDWKDVLRRFVQARCRVEASWARPKRRFLGEGLYLPALSGEQMGDILIGLDVSGSIDAETVASFFSELRGIKEDVNPLNIHVLYFHSEVERYDVFAQDEELEPAVTRSGGTAFSPIFRYADEHAIEPVCAVILTDLQCNDFGEPPAYPVLWVSNDSDRAPWGEVVMIDPGQL